LDGVACEYTVADTIITDCDEDEISLQWEVVDGIKHLSTKNFAIPLPHKGKLITQSKYLQSRILAIGVDSLIIIKHDEIVDIIDLVWDHAVELPDDLGCGQLVVLVEVELIILNGILHDYLAWFDRRGDAE